MELSPNLGYVSLVDVPGGDRRYQLSEGGSLRIGRFEGNEIVIPQANISRFHAVINVGDGGIFLTDLGSRNGTFINGSRVTSPAPLRNGDRIEIGGVALSVSLSNPTAPIDSSDGLTPDSGETQALGMKHIFAAVLVTDVSSYTRISEQFPAAEVAQMLTLFLDIAAKIVKASGGTVEKIIGDSLMAVWRENTENSGDRLVAAALAMARELRRELNTVLDSGAWRYQNLTPWDFKTSIAYGEALEGSVGGSDVREFTVIGDTINIAFRLNDLCSEVGERLVLSAGAAALSVEPTRNLGVFLLEGKGEKISVFAPSS